MSESKSITDTGCFVVGEIPPKPGVYEVVRAKGDSRPRGRDPELPDGQIELYEHPVRGLSFWDDTCDDGTDYSGHVGWFFLRGETLRPVSAAT